MFSRICRDAAKLPLPSRFTRFSLDFLSTHLSPPLSSSCGGSDAVVGAAMAGWTESVLWADETQFTRKNNIQYSPLPVLFLRSLSLSLSLLRSCLSTTLSISLYASSLVSLSLPLLVLTAYLFYLTVSRLTWRPPSTDA